MKLIIEINENDYNVFKNDIEHFEGYDNPLDNAAVAIAHGTIIPEGLAPLITKLIDDAKEAEN